DEKAERQLLGVDGALRQLGLVGQLAERRVADLLADQDARAREAAAVADEAGHYRRQEQGPLEQRSVELDAVAAEVAAKVALDGGVPGVARRRRTGDEVDVEVGRQVVDEREQPEMGEQAG